MTIKDTLNLILETREVLIEDYQYLYKKSPDNLELLNHAKQIVKDNNIEELLSDVLIDDTINVYKLLLLSAATSNLKE
jgi:hypothetical protein